MIKNLGVVFGCNATFNSVKVESNLAVNGNYVVAGNIGVTKNTPTKALGVTSQITGNVTGNLTCNASGLFGLCTGNVAIFTALVAMY